MQQAIGLGGDAKTHGGKLRQFLSLETIKPHINNELAMAIDSPQKFVRPGRGGWPAINKDKFEYTGREISARISYIDDFGCQHGYVNLSLDDVGMLIV